MTSVLLIYPYFNPKNDRSIFRFPPLGVGYLGSVLRNAGYDVQILDCTFMSRAEAMKKARELRADVVGIHAMATMKQDCLRLARYLRDCKLLVAGGPLASCDPLPFLEDFDIVVRGEGEQAMLEIVSAYENRGEMESIKGIVLRKGNEVIFTEPRELQPDLNVMPLPARDLFPNCEYIGYSKRRSGYAVTTIITTRGCPFICDFCSNAVFGVSYRERSPENVVDEVEQALSFGYDRIHFADDVFTINRKRVLRLCEEIKRRGLDFKWECLGRADSIDGEVATAMREAGCYRIFFGIESGVDSVLKMMNKKISSDDARKAITVAQASGLSTGAFFILCYPGETDDTVLRTLSFATSLPLDYLSFTAPYPLEGTALYERLKSRIKKEWETRKTILSDHVLIYDSDFSEIKIKFAILKGQAQFWMRKKLGIYAPFALKPFEIVTNAMFKVMR